LTLLWEKKDESSSIEFYFIMSETEVILVESFDGRSHSFLYIPFEQKTLQMQKMQICAELNLVQQSQNRNC